MALEGDGLWHRLSAHPIGSSDAPLSFVEKLARENRWSTAYAARVEEEYRRFCYLAMTAGHEVTPSDQVDQAWHLHMTYSRDYWDRFCPDVLGQKLHHVPTGGGAGELHRYVEQYAQTLRSYERLFGEVPPDDIWSPASERFGQQARSVRVYPGGVIFFNDWQGRVLLGLALLAAVASGLALGRAL